ncbi:GntR family transcriptional regulator [Actinocrinis sp.]|uniref:GntR family transcriptional regulator n=1 Tax=Actinocrinis sp. TaxID=1920516 RepID=UPI002D3D87BB|nr:GntR family transcriptional regulator [Actinocrinis sp.]HZP54632.1 GntR family transcriptional regulator [Actinocrinis sp.]
MSELGGDTPAYVQIANDLRARIEGGEIKPGEAIPSVSALIEQYDTSNSTAQAAVRALKAAGLVESKQGKGVYVRNVQRTISRSADYTSPPEGDDPARYRAPSRLLGISEVVPPSDVAEKLGLDDGARAVRRSRLMVEKGKPIELVDSYFPVEIARGTELDSPAGLKGGSLAALRRLGYIPRHPALEWVETRMPTASEARDLRLSAGTPVLRLLRVTYTDGRLPIEALVMVFGGDRYLLEYELPVHE